MVCHAGSEILSTNTTPSSPVIEGVPVWTPGAEHIAAAQLTHYRTWLAERGRAFDSYEALWRWSIDDLQGFWASIAEYFKIDAAGHGPVLASDVMPGATWFPGSRLNYAEYALSHEREGADALQFCAEGAPLQTLSWPELGARVRRLGVYLTELGVGPGDRVAAYLLNSPECVIAMLATASIGAIWACCGPDFGARGAVDRFAQLMPKVMFCVDGYRYGGKPFDRRTELRAILDALPTLERVIYLRRLAPDEPLPAVAKAVSWEEALSGPAVARDAYHYAQLPFAHPLWILFSSGTTGPPKAIVHCHGGMLLEQCKSLSLQWNVKPRERMFFFTTTGWMMWNTLVSALLIDAVPVLYDGNPAFPGPELLWGIADRCGASLFGASPTYVSLVEKAGLVPRDRFGLSELKTVMLAGSPVSAHCVSWLYQNVKPDLWVNVGSGGTDLCSGIVGGVTTEPLYAGEMQGRQLGMAAFAFDESGHEVIDTVGELVITRPAPSMPVGFWNDPRGERYRESYFDKYPGVWCHGDFFKVNSRGGCFVFGRSDATLNRHGIRIGTAEVYRALQEVPEIDDSLIVNLDLPGGRFFMPLFVKLTGELTLDELLTDKIRGCLRQNYSARHVPDTIQQVTAIPYTLTGKKMEIPVRRILMGMSAAKAADRSTMRDPGALDFYVEYADQVAVLLR